MQLSLDPFIEGGFIDRWMRLVGLASPDTIKDHPLEVKVLGSAFLNTLTRVCSSTDPIKFGNMLLLMTGPRRSRKSWLTDFIEGLLGVLNGPYLIPHGTPEAVGEAIGKIKWGFVTANEAGEIVANATKEGYMSAWGFLMNKVYMLESIQMLRRQKRKSVFVPGKSYYVSLMLNALPEDISLLFEKWRGLERRFIPLYFTRAPRRAWRRRVEGSDEFIDFIWLCKILRQTVFFIDIPEDPLNELGEELDRKDRNAPEDVKSLNDALWEYSIKLLMSWLVDVSVPKIAEELKNIVTRNCHHRNNTFKEKKGRIEPFGIQYDIATVTDYGDNLPLKEDLFEENKGGEPFVVHLSPLSPTCHQVLVTIHRIVTPLWGQMVTMVTNLSGFDPKIAGRISEFLNLLRERKVVTLREAYRGPLKQVMRLREVGGVKNLWTKVLGPLEATGQVVVRRLGRRRTFLIHPSARICGTCALFHRPECPEESEDTLKAGGMMNVDDEACERWVPLWGDEG